MGSLDLILIVSAFTLTTHCAPIALAGSSVNAVPLTDSNQTVMPIMFIKEAQRLVLDVTMWQVSNLETLIKSSRFPG